MSNSMTPDIAAGKSANGQHILKRSMFQQWVGIYLLSHLISTPTMIPPYPQALYRVRPSYLKFFCSGFPRCCFGRRLHATSLRGWRLRRLGLMSFDLSEWLQPLSPNRKPFRLHPAELSPRLYPRQQHASNLRVRFWALLGLHGTGIFPYIWLTCMGNVGKYSSPMKNLGNHAPAWIKGNDGQLEVPPVLNWPLGDSIGDSGEVPA